MSQQILLESLPEGQRRHLDPASPLPMRAMAAKGMAPLPPIEMVTVLCGLSLDDDDKLATTARATLKALPDRVLAPALDGGVHGIAAQFLAPLLLEREPLLERLLLANDTPDEAVASVAANVSDRLAEIIAANQGRCARSQAVVDGLRHNPNLIKSSRDRMFDFLVRSGVFYDGMPEIEEAIARLSPAEMREAADKVVLPANAAGLVADQADDDRRADEVAKVLEDKRGGDATERVPLLKLIASLKVPQKIAVAVKGNKEARTMLIRDANRTVATAAIRSPRITEAEVAAAARSRSVSDEVISIIARSKEMSRSYAVKLALVNNPKSPQVVVLRFLPLLRLHDLQGLARSKNIPSAVSMQAKRMLQRRK